MNTVIDFLICIMQIIGHLLVFLFGISGCFVWVGGTIMSFFLGAISRKESIVLIISSIVLGSILMLCSFGLKLLLQ
jgi:hypothetical protein